MMLISFILQFQLFATCDGFSQITSQIMNNVTMTNIKMQTFFLSYRTCNVSFPFNTYCMYKVIHTEEEEMFDNFLHVCCLVAHKWVLQESQYLQKNTKIKSQEACGIIFLSCVIRMMQIFDISKYVAI